MENFLTPQCPQTAPNHTHLILKRPQTTSNHTPLILKPSSNVLKILKMTQNHTPLILKTSSNVLKILKTACWLILKILKMPLGIEDLRRQPLRFEDQPSTRPACGGGCSR